MGIEITFDWASAVLAHKAKGGSDSTMTNGDRIRAALEDLAGVAAADYVWLLCPVTPSFGAGVEFGKALGKTPIICSGPWLASIFTSLAHRVFDTHAEALDWLAAKARAR